MDSRQLAVEQVVVEYFGTRSDTELRRGSAGTYLLALLSPEARAQFGGREHQVLTFDAETSFQHPDWDLINTTHPYLDVIRNDLASHADEDPRISEAYCPAQPISAAGRITLPHGEIMGPVEKLEADRQYHPYFVLTYKVIIETDERQDYLIRRCFDGLSGASRKEAIAHLVRLPLVNGRPKTVKASSQLADLEQVLRRGQHEIETLARAEIAALSAQSAEQLAREKLRLEQHCQSQLELTSKRDEEGRRRLRETLKKEIEDFERKYACRSRAALISILLLWTPVIRYRISAASKRSSFLVEGFSYDAILDLLVAEPCKTCGNRERFSLCCTGKHVACGETTCSQIANCSACGDPYCSEHGRGCSHCGLPTCFADQAECGYGSHTRDSGFCPSCRKASFEERVICLGCAVQCDLCGRAFPNKLILTCSIGDERFCSDHKRSVDGSVCSECRKPACKRHARDTADGRWACVPHSREASCCGRVFGHSQLVPCVEDETELLCSDHRLSCVLCKKAICQKHAKRSWQKEPLCSNDARPCVQCDRQASRIYRRDALRPCVICRGLACGDHVRKCDICQVSAFCKAHESDQPACVSCGRASCGAKSCSASSSTCKLCGISYCRHCVEGSGVCTTCAHPARENRISPSVPLLQAVAAMAHQELSKTAQVMLKSLKECSASASQNRTYRVVVIDYRPSPWLLWKKSKRLRLVVAHENTLHRVGLENVG